MRLTVHFEDRPHYFRCIAQTRHFVLSSQLALLRKPIVEETGVSDRQGEWEQSHVCIPLGFVVGIERLQLGIQCFGKRIRISRCRDKFDQPVVPSFARRGIEVGSCGVFCDARVLSSTYSR